MSIALFVLAQAVAKTGPADATPPKPPVVESPAPEGVYTLFNPTPDDKLRPMSTERPSKTDSALTLDPGRFQIETSLLNHARNDDDGVKTRAWTPLAFTTLRLGLTDRVDAEVIFDAYRNARIEDRNAGTDRHFDGFGDTLLRAKYNFMGNDGGAVALAVLPYVKLPTNGGNLGNDSVEGGVELPFSVALTDGYSVSGMTVVARLRDADDQGYSPSYINALMLGKNLSDTVFVYGEYYTQRYTDAAARWANSLDVGVVYAVSENLHLDTGANVGVSDASEDLNLFVGAAYRF